MFNKIVCFKYKSIGIRFDITFAASAETVLYALEILRATCLCIVSNSFLIYCLSMASLQTEPAYEIKGRIAPLYIVSSALPFRPYLSFAKLYKFIITRDAFVFK